MHIFFSDGHLKIIQLTNVSTFCFRSGSFSISASTIDEYGERFRANALFFAALLIMLNDPFMYRSSEHRIPIVYFFTDSSSLSTRLYL